ncbi:hypothetical protein V7114_19390 [Neobacillus niacini]|uniref:hypothetical protein n=1 Tax=Neobacillus niacini TaxID=86668 RepID=UPI002FFFF816
MKPKFCPNCGKELIDESFYLKSFTSILFNEGKKDEVVVLVNGWGIDCYYCDWGGEILPNHNE